MSDSIEARALRWASTGKTGVSSKAIFGVMTGNPPDDGYCYPHDAGDFDRCHNLLCLIPEWRERMGEMATVGPEWEVLAQHWSELTELYEKSDELVYKRIQELVRPVEDKRDGLIRIGGGAIYIKPRRAR